MSSWDIAQLDHLGPLMVHWGTYPELTRRNFRVSMGRCERSRLVAFELRQF